MELLNPREAAAFALSLLDLTNLRDDCDNAAIENLCLRAQTPYGNTAAICIWPRFVAHARQILGSEHPVRIATVVNFPSGDLAVATVIDETRQAIEDGADEIDMVIPYRKLLAGDEAAVTEMVEAVRGACPNACLKVILETGEAQGQRTDPPRFRTGDCRRRRFHQDFDRQGRGQRDARSRRHHAAGDPGFEEAGRLQACRWDLDRCGCRSLFPACRNDHGPELDHALHLPFWRVGPARRYPWRVERQHSRARVGRLLTR